ncbi:MAG: hypothetical protein WBG86_17940 [Polyangiales bacterium]
MATTKTTNDNTTRFNIKVPLGDADHPNEEKGSTKIVKRKLAGLKGAKPKRSGIVFWRKVHYVASENPENAGSFEVSRKAKDSEVPETAAPKKSAAKAKATKTPKAAAKKGAKARAKKGASNKEADSRKRAA